MASFGLHDPGRFSILTRLLVFGLLSASSPAVAAAEVDLELVLAADISDSMDQDEQRLQRNGYAEAFRDTEIINAITAGPRGRIAVTFIEWGDLARPRVVVPWHVIDGSDAAKAFAEKLERSRIGRRGRTSISGALSFGAHLIENNDYRGDRRVIDVSGDGPNNQGRPVDAARDSVVARGIVINGLPILIKLNNPRDPFGSGFDKRVLDIYYRDCVIGGPGAFMVPIRSRAELAEGIRYKLLLEIAGRSPTLIPAAWPSSPRLSC